MKTEIFKQEVSQLVKKAEDLTSLDYDGANSIIREFRSMVNTYRENLNSHILEHLSSIETDLRLSKKYKRDSEKMSYWRSGISGLISDIESMDSIETRFPLN